MNITLRRDGDNDVCVDDAQVEHWKQLGYRVVGPVPVKKAAAKKAAAKKK